MSYHVAFCRGSDVLGKSAPCRDSSEQAASVEETSSSLEDMAAVSRKASELTLDSEQLINESLNAQSFTTRLLA